MLRTFSSKTSASTSLWMPITSRHSLLEYWAFAQHWHSILVNQFDKSGFTYCETANSEKASDNLRISSNTSLLYFAWTPQYWACLSCLFFFQWFICIKLSYSSQIVTKIKIPFAKLNPKNYSTKNYVRSYGVLQPYGIMTPSFQIVLWLHFFPLTYKSHRTDAL